MTSNSANSDDPLASKLPDPSYEPWTADNCAEVSACGRAIAAGVRLQDLEVYPVGTRRGTYAPPCRNCSTWLPGGN